MVNIAVKANKLKLLRTDVLYVAKEMLPVNLVITDNDPGKVKIELDIDKNVEAGMKSEDSGDVLRIVFGNPGMGGGTRQPVKIGLCEDGVLFMMIAVYEKMEGVYQFEYNLYLEG